RPVESEVLAHGLQSLRRGVAPGDARRRVGARRREEDQEHEDADAEHHKQHLAQPFDDRAEHQVFRMRSFERGSRASRTPSPKMLSASTVMTMAMPGASATIGRVYSSSCPSWMMVPQLASGGCTPIDRNDRADSVSMLIAIISGTKTISVVITL